MLKSGLTLPVPGYPGLVCGTVKQWLNEFFKELAGTVK
jgi:hypothetical protein